MGGFGSKEDIEKLGVVYGFNSNDFPWRSIDNREVYHTNCIIITYHDKKYVLTTRDKLLSCKNIYMYYAFSADEDIIMKNDMYVLFQSIELNLIILATIGEKFFDESKSQLIAGNDFSKRKGTEYILNNIFHKPTTRSLNHIICLDLNMSKGSNIDLNIYDVKFERSIVYDETYLPNNYLYQFQFTKKPSNDAHGICGSIVINKNSEIIGTVSRIKDQIYVLPKKVIYRMFHNFINSEYCDLLSLPFTYSVVNDKIVIDNEYSIDTITGNSCLKENDQLLSIDNKELMIKNDDAIIFDDDFDEFLPLDIYLKLNLQKGISIPLKLLRKKHFLQLDCYGTKIPQLILTNVPTYLPEFSIPFVNLNGIIFVQLTHELIHITLQNNIRLENELINKLKIGELESSYVIIIDCLNLNLAKKYHLPQLKRKSKLECPFITRIGDINNPDLSMIRNSEIMEIQMGFSFKKLENIVI